jgi:hypothetical protein
MARPSKVFEEINEGDEQVTILRPKREGPAFLTKDEITKALAEHIEEGIKLSFPTDTTWELSINFADLPWYPRVKAKAQSQGKQLSNKAWLAGGNMMMPLKDVINSANILISYRQNFGAYHRVEFNDGKA